MRVIESEREGRKEERIKQGKEEKEKMERKEERESKGILYQTGEKESIHLNVVKWNNVTVLICHYNYGSSG